MRDGGEVAATGWLERASAAALVVLAAAAVFAAVRLGADTGGQGEDLLAQLRAGTERRLALERDQIRPALAAVSRGEWQEARGEAAASLARFKDNSQLHLLLASLHRQDGAQAAALREYRRAVELVRDYADPRSPEFLGSSLAPWLSRLQPAVSGEALADLRFLQRALAGGCS